MNPVVHVLRRMGGRATTLLPFSLAIGLLFQDIAAAARPLLWPLAVALLMLALARTDWMRVTQLLRRPGSRIVLSLVNLILRRSPYGRSGRGSARCSACRRGRLSAMALGDLGRRHCFLPRLIPRCFAADLITNFPCPFTPPRWRGGFRSDLHISVLDLSLGSARSWRWRSGVGRHPPLPGRFETADLDGLGRGADGSCIADDGAGRAMVEPFKLAFFVCAARRDPLQLVVAAESRF
jgi:hypothetical protein